MEKNLQMGHSNGPYQEPEEHPYQIESSVLIFARLELQLLCKTYPTKDNPPIVRYFIHEILALVDKFGHSGQSGGSAPFVATSIANTVEKLCTFKPLLPITDLDEEWAEVSYPSSPTDMQFQNKRLSSIFKNNEGKSWFLDAIAWKTQKGTTWSSNSVKLPDDRIITSKQFIKSFPFEPKTFYIDVIETEVTPDNWVFTVKDENQLKEVFEYYDFYL